MKLRELCKILPCGVYLLFDGNSTDIEVVGYVDVIGNEMIVVSDDERITEACGNLDVLFLVPDVCAIYVRCKDEVKGVM